MCIGGAQLLVAHLGRLEVGHPGLKLRFSEKWGWTRKKVKGSQVTGGHQSGLLKLARSFCQNLLSYGFFCWVTFCGPMHTLCRAICTYVCVCVWVHVILITDNHKQCCMYTITYAQWYDIWISISIYVYVYTCVCVWYVWWLTSVEQPRGSIWSFSASCCAFGRSRAVSCQQHSEAASVWPRRSLSLLCGPWDGYVSKFCASHAFGNTCSLMFTKDS